MLTLADVHRAADHARQGWDRLSPGRGKFQDLVFLMLANQPQGGIVFDSDPYDEWIETINKLGASLFRAAQFRFAHGQHMDMLTRARRKYAVHRVGGEETSRRAK